MRAILSKDGATLAAFSGPGLTVNTAPQSSSVVNSAFGRTELALREARWCLGQFGWRAECDSGPALRRVTRRHTLCKYNDERRQVTALNRRRRCAVLSH